MRKKFFSRIFCLVLFFSAFNLSITKSQDPCGFDIILNDQIENDNLLKEMIDLDETQMQNIISGNGPIALAINGPNDYTVPVVVHIIHLGEPEGMGTNISDDQVNSAIQALNDDFRNVSGTGVDINVEFCLAQRDPDGFATDGIIRKSGLGTCAGNLCYDDHGISTGGDLEFEVKNLSIWPNSDYYNIWVVSEINGNNAAFVGIQGYAYLAISQPVDLDGTVILHNAFGTEGTVKPETNLNKILTHEIGHGFNLYHSFEGDCMGVCCPDNDNPGMDGDRCEDTPPHRRSILGCDETSDNDCDNNSSSNLFVHNHMNYSEESCRNEFTDDQRSRIRCALMDIRSSLMTSIGCEPACTSASASFTASAPGGEQGINIQFTNTSTGHTSSSWLINGQEVETDEDMKFDFEFPGAYDVCLRVENTNCVDQECMKIEIVPGEPCFLDPIDCQLVFNGDLVQNSVPLGQSRNVNFFGESGVCNWDHKFATPFFCSEINDENAIGLFSNGQRDHMEGVITQDELNLTVGESYKVSFEYSVANIRGSGDDVRSRSLTFGFTNDLTRYTNLHAPDAITAHANDQIIVDLPDLPYDYSSVQNVNCYAENLIFHYHEETFEFDGSGENLYFVNIGRLGQEDYSDNIIYVKNISITDCNVSCNPNPTIAYDLDCPNSFTATSEEPGSTFYWEFLCDGYTATGPTVNRDFPLGTTCEVCVSVTCPFEGFTRICETVTIPEETVDCASSCTDINIIANTCMQENEQENEYITNFTITVPTGTGPCGELPLQSNSSTVEVDLVSYAEVPNGNIGLTDISIGMVITTPPDLDIISNSVTAGLTLCDPDGKIICYNIRVSGSECESCVPLDVSSNAICMDTNPVDGLYNYVGNITLNMDPLFSEYVQCDGISSQVGFEIVDFEDNNGNIEIDYSIEASSADFNISTIICVEGSDGVEYCIPVTINVPDPCPEPPTKCVQEWVEKTVEGDCEIVDGQIKYTFTMSNVGLNNGSLQSCHGNMWATIEGGGNAVVNYGNIQGNKISFSIDIFMPCDFDQDQYSYELSLIVCNDQGEMVCLLFRVIFPDCTKDCRSGGKRSVRTSNTNDISIYPNPASQYLTISVNKDKAKLLNITIYDQIGRSILSQSLIGRITEIDVSELTPGIHFVKITDDNQEVVEFKKLIIMK